MEREVMLTGVGGQGVQLAAQVLARAATAEGRGALMFGTYLGAMRGGNTDATVVVADGPVLAPPIISRTWAALALHHEFWPELRAKVRAGGVVLVDTTVFAGDVGDVPGDVVEIPATELASEAGSPQAGAMVMLGALAALTGLVEVASLAVAMADSLPPYRTQHVATNEAAIGAGAAAVTAGTHPAWTGVRA